MSTHISAYEPYEPHLFFYSLLTFFLSHKVMRKASGFGVSLLSSISWELAFLGLTFHGHLPKTQMKT